LSSSDDAFVQIGRVGKPHGLDGSFAVEDASDAPERFARDAVLYVEGEPARILESKRARGRPVIRLDRAVERGAPLSVLRSDLPEPEPEAYYVFDLVGLEVEEEGERVLGRVEHVSPAPANDVLELDSGLSLPFVEACVLEVDVEAGRILVARGFGDPG
jgi:16S rRNA processing protein RimM